MSSYVVRNKNRERGSARYLNAGFGGSTSVPLMQAHVFKTFLSADIETEKYDTWRETRRLVWAIKWTDGERYTHYLPAVEVPGYWGRPRAEAKLFDSPEAARKHLVKHLRGGKLLHGRFTIVRSTKAVVR